jgi:DNA/RNA endonuclease YhcR with UshA esterase domain
MKKFFIIIAIACAAASCGEQDWADQPSYFNNENYAPHGFPYGNNSLVCTNQMTISELKSKYESAITSNKTIAIEGGGQIVGKIAGNDIGGNLFKEIYIQDNTGGISLRIDEYSLYAYLPVSEEIMIDLDGMYIGGYGTNPQLGTLYNNSVGRMSQIFWSNHFRIITAADGSVKPKEIYSMSDFTRDDICKVVTIKNVSFVDADGKTAYSDGVSNYTNRTVNELTSKFVVRTSSYADFAKTPLPKDKVDLTGILTIYNGTWQLLIRSEKDVKPLQ